jgi:hypothetical protein
MVDVAYSYYNAVICGAHGAVKLSSSFIHLFPVLARSSWIKLLSIARRTLQPSCSQAIYRRCAANAWVEMKPKIFQNCAYGQYWRRGHACLCTRRTNCRLVARFPATLRMNHRLPLALIGATSSFVSLCGAKRARGTLEGVWTPAARTDSV